MRHAILLLAAVLFVAYWAVGCAVTPGGGGDNGGGDGGGNGGNGGGGDGGGNGGDNGGGDGGGDGGGGGGTVATLAVSVAPGTELNRGDDATLTAAVTGAEGDVAYAWSANGGTLVRDPSDGSKATWTAPNLAGRYAITCEATLADGDSVSAAAHITVPNSPPVIESVTTSVTTVGGQSRVDLACDATDPNGDALYYEWAADGGTMNGGYSADAWWLSAPDTGDYTVTCTVYDANWASDVESVQIHVLGPSGWVIGID